MQRICLPVLVGIFLLGILGPACLAARQATPQPQALPSPANAEERSRQALVSALQVLASGEADTASLMFSNIAATGSPRSLVEEAQCLAGASTAVNGEIRPAEDIAGTINRALVANQQEWKPVISECTRLLNEVAPRTPSVKRAGIHYYLGLIGFDEPEHMRNLREAIKLRPDFGEAVYQLAVHLLGQGDMDEAATLFLRAAEQHPEWAEPRANLGVVYNLTGRPADAVRELREALKVRPEYGEAHGQLGMALYLTGDYDGALEECGRGLQHEPENPFHYSCAAVVLLEKGRNSEALAYVKRATDLAPNHETFLLVLAAAQLANGLQADALNTLQRVLAIQPRLRTDPTRAEKADLLRGRALQLARQLLDRPRQ